MALKTLHNYLSFQFSYILGGKKNYEKIQKDYYSLQRARIKNTKLANLLEKECKKHNGTLTYAEFLHVDQFSAYGYHASHKDFGETPTFERWPKALAHICQSYEIDTIFEIGPGNGKLGLKTLQEADKKRQKLFWAGIELNTGLQEEAKKQFSKAGFGKKIIGLSDSLNDIQLSQKTLAVFSYSLDSIPPEMLLNTTSKITFPNALVGTSIQESILEEKILSQEDTQKRDIFLTNGILSYKEYSFDLRSLRLFPMQRIYLPLQAFTMLLEVIEMLPLGSLILILDEFRRPLTQPSSQHLLLPKDLGLFDRDLRDSKKFYEQAGEHLLYFSSFLENYLTLLQAAGVTNTTYSEEHLAAGYLQQQDHKELQTSVSHLSNCYAILGKKSKNDRESKILLTFPLAYP